MRSTLLKILAGASLLLVTALGAVPAGASPANIVQNGSFESGSYNNTGDGWDTLSVPDSTTIDSWTVSMGSVDWIDSYWSAENGHMSIDLNGNNPGAVSQTLNTVPGATYNVTFYLSGNFDELGGPEASRTVTVQDSSGGSQQYTFDWFSAWGHSNMGWTPETYKFTASSNTTTLTFAGDSATSSWGPVIDNVSATMAPATSGAECKGGGWEITSNPMTLLPFMNQGQCVSYFATMGDTPIGR